MITCNHFSPFDNYVIYKSIEKELPKGKLYKVIREGELHQFSRPVRLFFQALQHPASVEQSAHDDQFSLRRQRTSDPRGDGAALSRTGDVVELPQAAAFEARRVQNGLPWRRARRAYVYHNAGTTNGSTAAVIPFSGIRCTSSTPSIPIRR